MEKIIKYKNKDIKFFNLLEQGHNIDRFISNGTLFNRPDHKFDYLVSLLKPNSIVFDIGAYIGSFAIPLHLEGMKVFAFEGFPDNYYRLLKNCSQFNIDVRLVAVSDNESKVYTKFNDCTANEAIAREIEYVIFDDYLKRENLPKPDLIKLDIEGMETLALHGMTNLIKNIRPIWQIGYHYGLDVKYDGYPGFVSVENGGFDFNEFKNNNYIIKDHTGKNVMGFSGFGEYICIPKEKI